MKITSKFLKYTGLILIFFAFLSPLKATIIFVNDDAGGSNNGTSWANAYISLNTAITNASSGDTIVVAAGIYTPHASDRTVSFTLKQGVSLLGGFAGNESTFSQATLDNRDLSLNETVLSGDLSGNDIGFTNNGENSYHVIYTECTSSSITSATLVDGITVSGGNANYYTGSDYTHLRGGGISLVANNGYSCSPTFRNIIIEYNTAQFGAGVFIDALNTGSECSPDFQNFLIQDNQTYESDNTQVSSGAGISVSSINATSNPGFSNGEIINNTVVEYQVAGVGGGVIISATDISGTSVSSPVFTDVLFCRNLASGGGSDISTGTSSANGTVSPAFINVTIAGMANSVPVYNLKYGGLGNIAPTFVNTIINTTNTLSVSNNPAPGSSGPNPVYSYCNIRYAFIGGPWYSAYGTNGGNNMDLPSFFADTANCNVTLYDNSPEIGAGNAVYGNNIGYYQGSGLIYLDIEDLPDVNECNDDSIYVFKLGIRDEPADSFEYTLTLHDGGLLPGYIKDTIINDTLNLTLNLPGGWYVKDTISVTLSNLSGEKDSTGFIFNLNRRPVETGYNIGVFNASDTTFLVTINEDPEISGELFDFDGASSSSNWKSGFKPGKHYGLISYGGCSSDTIHIVLPEYVNNIPLAINYYNRESSTVSLCKGDTTLNFEFAIDDDNPDLINWFYNTDFGQAIPDSNITLSTLDTSYVFNVDVPDTSGFYRVSIHAENIFGEMSNLYFDIYVLIPPVVDSVQIHDYGYDTCIYPDVTNFEYSQPLTVWLDGTDITKQGEYCDILPGEHTLIAYSGECPSEPYAFFIEEAVDTGTGGTFILNNHLDESFVIYPQPARESFYVQGIKGFFTIEIIDMAGKTVLHRGRLTEKEPVSISALKKGIYTIIIKSQNAYATKRLIIR